MKWNEYFDKKYYVLKKEKKIDYLVVGNGRRQCAKCNQMYVNK